jgi:hypothetical protein
MMRERDEPNLLQLQEKVSNFIQGLQHPIIAQDGVEIFDLTESQWRLEVHFGKLLLTVSNGHRTATRRIEEISHRDKGQLGVRAWRQGNRQSLVLEFREKPRSPAEARGAARGQFRERFLAMLGREFHGWRIERTSQRSDRAHSFSSWYVRGVATQAGRCWAFLGMEESASPAGADNALAFGLIWLDWVRQNSGRSVVQGLRLFLPAECVPLVAPRAACLNARTTSVALYAWKPENAGPVAVDLRDSGNVEARVGRRVLGETLRDYHKGRIASALGEIFPYVDLVPDAGGDSLAVRLRGLEIARVEGRLAAKVHLPLTAESLRWEDFDPAELRKVARGILAIRRADSPDVQHGFYRWQPERWLESLVVRDITRIDPELSPACVYQQVPAFTGMDRGVVDVLGITRGGRLAVLELKVQEEISLPMQALDYWRRVMWLNERGEFQKAGYFPGHEPLRAAPLLYLVSPAFRFHSTTKDLCRYFSPQICVIEVGVNENWRGGLKILFRHELARDKGAGEPRTG